MTPSAARGNFPGAMTSQKISKALLLFALFCLASSIHAQQAATSTLSGTVIDQHGAVVPGTQIIATQKATAVSRVTSTTDTGFFSIASLPVGEYEVKAAAAGFKTALVSSVVLQVGQNEAVNFTLEPGEINETVHNEFKPIVDTTSTAVEGVISAQQINNLPLNGRNFLELALLIPGNAPAPNFDPTKTNTVVISSAGQLGRGGNVTVDGADNNDDVVGGPLQNISQEAVHEFQIATNRFSAQLGRSGSSVINIVTKAGTNEFHGSGSFYFRDNALQGLPATFDRGLQETPPFDREQYAFAFGGPVKRERVWFFSSFEYRNQDGATLVGERDLPTRAIQRTFAMAPLNDLLSTHRFDWRPGDDLLSFRYSLQREDDIAPSTLDRTIGSASQRQASKNNIHSILGSYTHVLSANDLNTFNFSFSDSSTTSNP